LLAGNGNLTTMFRRLRHFRYIFDVNSIGSSSSSTSSGGGGGEGSGSGFLYAEVRRVSSDRTRQQTSVGSCRQFLAR